MSTSVNIQELYLQMNEIQNHTADKMWWNSEMKTKNPHLTDQTTSVGGKKPTLSRSASASEEQLIFQVIKIRYVASLLMSYGRMLSTWTMKILMKTEEKILLWGTKMFGN